VPRADAFDRARTRARTGSGKRGDANSTDPFDVIDNRNKGA
jgi:hypothetical protein